MLKNLLIHRFFQAGTRVILHFADGSQKDAILRNDADGNLNVFDLDGQPIPLNENAIASLDAIGLMPPLERKEQHRPLMLKPNGVISNCNANHAGRISYRSAIGTRLEVRFKCEVLYEPEWSETSPETLVGREVICHTGELRNNIFWAPFVIAVCSVDDALDKISKWARQGSLDEALKLASVVQQQMPNDADVCRIYDELHTAILNYKKQSQIDAYAPILSNPGLLPARGTIVSCMQQNDEITGGYIVDCQSHELLFFTENNFIYFDTYEPDFYQGQQVTYVPIRNKKGKLEARCVMAPHNRDEVLKYARGLPFQQNLNAWGMARLLVESDPDDSEAQKLFVDREHKLGPSKWNVASLPAYTGPTTKKIVEIDVEMPKVEVCRSIDHTEMVDEFTDNPTYVKLAFNEPMSEKTLSGRSSLSDCVGTDEVEGEPAQIKAVPNQQKEAEKQRKKAERKKAKNTSSGSNRVDWDKLITTITTQNTEEPDDGQPRLKANCTIRIRLGNVCYILNESGNSANEFTFPLKNIVDENLLDLADDQFRLDRDLRGKPIVCQLDQKKRTAYAVMSPTTVAAALQMVDNLKESARERYEAEDFTEALRLLRNAVGVAENILDNYPRDYDIIQTRDQLALLQDQVEEVAASQPHAADSPLPRSGVIKKVSFTDPDGTELVGIIYDDLGRQEITYLSSSILLNTVNESENEPVVYTIRLLNDNPVAWCIHRPMPESDMIRLAEELYNRRHSKLEAWGLVCQVLEDHPEHSEASALKERYEADPEVNQNLPQVIRRLFSEKERVVPEIDEARILEREHRFKEAIDALTQAVQGYEEQNLSEAEADTSVAFDNMKRIENCVREIHWTYQRWMDFIKAEEQNSEPLTEVMTSYITFGQERIEKLSRRYMPNLSALRTYYVCTKQWKALEIVMREYIAACSRSRQLKARHELANAYARLANFYLLQGKINEASRECERALLCADGGSCILANIVNAVLHLHASTTKDTGVYLTDSKVSMRDLNVDVPQPRPMNLEGQDITPTDEYRFYCSFRSSALSGNNFITHLNLALEAFLPGPLVTDSNWDIDAQRWVIQPIQAARRLVACMHYGVQWPIWRHILLLCMANKGIGRIVMNYLFDLDANFAVSLLNHFGKSLPLDAERIQFGNAFEDLRCNWGEHYKTWTAYAQAIGTEHTTLQELPEFFDHTLVSDPVWMLERDVFVVNDIHLRLPDRIGIYLRADSARLRNAAQGQLKEYIRSKKREMVAAPTLLEMTAIWPLLDRVADLLSHEQETLQQSAPDSFVEILTVSAMDEQRRIQVQIQVSNKARWGRPMSHHHLVLHSEAFIEDMVEDDSVHLIFGAEEHTFTIFAKVRSDWDEQQKAVLTISYAFMDGSLPGDPCESTLETTLTTTFEEIDNPYEMSGQVCEDTQMFFGRDEILKRLVNSIHSTSASQYLIYGQKRSGKTSLMFHLQKMIQKDNEGLQIPRVLCGKTSMLDVDSTDHAFYKILVALKDKLDEYRDAAKNDYRKLFIERKKQNLPTEDLCQQPVPEFNLPEVELYESLSGRPSEKFEKQMRILRDSLKSVQGWENCRIIVFVDEFTSIHKAIKDGLVRANFMKSWKRIQEQSDTRFTAILIGQDVTPSLQRDYSNVYAIFHDYRLTYLDSESALNLIRVPMSRVGVTYRGESASLLKDYTAGNPFYIWLFCDELVNYLNKKRNREVISKDVEVVADEMAHNMDSKYFENLVLAGEDDKVSEFSVGQVLPVLKRIALESEMTGWCPRTLIMVNGADVVDGARIDDILQNLIDREVIIRQGEQYQIIVKLYSKWLCVQDKKGV